VMGPEGAVNILNKKDLAAAADPAALRAQLVEEYRQRFSNPYVAASVGFLDGVIEPNQTRAALVSGLRMLQNKRDTVPAKKHGTMPL